VDHDAGGGSEKWDPNSELQSRSDKFQEGWAWETALDGAVNKCNLSSGETGEFASENLGSGLNPGG